MYKILLYGLFICILSVNIAEFGALGEDLC